MGVELGGSYLDAITELVTIMRFRYVSVPSAGVMSVKNI